MTSPLPSRPNVEHLRTQAKSLLAAFRKGERDAIAAFREHLPAARKLSAAATRSSAFKLADAQSVVARRAGFASWKALTHHVETLRSLEGEWHFESLHVNGQDVPRAMLGHSKLLFDGDRFRMESPEGNYDGRFRLDTTVSPSELDIDFVEGPEAGNSSYGIVSLEDDALTICLGLVGSSRPEAFRAPAGSGHALERLTRASKARPANVSGGTAPTGEERKAKGISGTTGDAIVDPALFDGPITPLMQRLEGTWVPVRMVMNGEEMRADWLPFGSRISTGNEVKVIFGGQVMLHAKVRFDESITPIAVDYLNLTGAGKGKVSRGIMEWVGDEVRFLIAKAGDERPADFSAPGSGTFSQWKRK